MSTPENEEAAFIAKITASTTHEIRNVLAIVRESAGLIGDMVRALEKRGMVNRERMTKAVDRIDAQVTRGAEIVANLNRFAHSLDKPEQELDLGQEVQQAAFLCRRFAQQRKQTVRVVCEDDGRQTVAGPLHLQIALYWGIECCLEQLPEGGTLLIRTGQHDDRPALDFVLDADVHPGPAGPVAADNWVGLTRALGNLGAVVETTDPACHFRILLPRSGDA
jgi:C4-dicarboxylate-specific signal transduction histidine kinase